MKNRQWLLARRPRGAIQDSDFNFVETDAPTPGEGEVLVRNLMLSCDPPVAPEVWEFEVSGLKGRAVVARLPD